MSTRTPSPFRLGPELEAKAAPVLLATDVEHFAAIAERLERSVAEIEKRLAAERRAPGGSGQEAMDRDLEVHRLSSRLRLLRRYGLDLCLGRMVPADATGPVYVGRLGLTGGDGRRLLVDWRTPAAEPFFAATHGNPMGLASRRRYRWSGGEVTDYWDEVFDLDHLEGRAALDDQSAFIASLGGSRDERMRDVLATIQADQDAVVRASSRGALVVDGGPGTGKTVVALHRTAYLLHADERLREGHGRVLFVGPHRRYLAYVGDVLPSLGEDGVLTCTLGDLVPEGASGVGDETDPRVARLKASADLVRAVEPAVALYEELPTEGMDVATTWGDVWLSPSDWAEAFAVVDPGTPHNDAREQIWDALLTILVGRLVDDDAADADADAERARAVLARDRELATALDKAWTLLEPTDVVGDLWSVPAYLRACAPWLGPDDVALLQRRDPQAWTTSDLPLLDAARRRLGDPTAGARRRRREAALVAEREEANRVVEHLVASDDSMMRVMSMLRGDDLQRRLVDQSAHAEAPPDLLAGPFAHVVVDEAQELTDAEWQMLLARCPSRSLTVVGDRAQARHGFAESWEQRLERVGLDRVRRSTLTVNYRTPEPVMAEALPVIRAAVPDANVPTSVRPGPPVRHGDLPDVADLHELVAAWEAGHPEGTGCVVGAPWFTGTARVRSLTPLLTKGLEFDLVVLVDPDSLGTDVEGAVDHYVAMTRTTQQLVVLTST